MEQGKHPSKNKVFLNVKLNPAFMVPLTTADQERDRDFLGRPIFKGTKLFMDLF